MSQPDLTAGYATPIHGYTPQHGTEHSQGVQHNQIIVPMLFED